MRNLLVGLAEFFDRSRKEVDVSLLPPASWTYTVEIKLRPEEGNLDLHLFWKELVPLIRAWGLKPLQGWHSNKVWGHQIIQEGRSLLSYHEDLEEKLSSVLSEEDGIFTLITNWESISPLQYSSSIRTTF